MTVDTAYRILVLGGYGQFGSRIVRMLAAEPDCHIIIAGRHEHAARALLNSLKSPAASLSVAALDAQAPDFATALALLKVDLVIHTAGPFDDHNYTVARVCIAAGVHYIDLADNRQFVLGIGELDGEAMSRNVLAVTGASTVPALSCAVVDHYRREFSRIDRIDIGITPGSRAPRGRSTIESVLSYCGKPYQAWRDGQWRRVFGWQDLHPVHYPTLGTRWFANCDVPDLDLVPQRYRVTQTVMFSAALELRIMQFSVWAMSWLARAGIVKNWTAAAGLLKAASDLLVHFGSNDGGMHVHIVGLDTSGQSHSIRWFLIALDGDGPAIPCAASVALARKLVRGELRMVGARACVDMLTLEEFQHVLRDLRISYVLG